MIVLCGLLHTSQGNPVELPFLIVWISLQMLVTSVYTLNGKSAVQVCSVCVYATVCSHFFTKDPDRCCSVVLEDRYIITQEGEVQEMLFI